MLTLNASGKTGSQAVEIVQAALIGNENEDEFKILIDGPSQSEGLTKFLSSEGFSVLLEDDDGILFIMATKTQEHNYNDEEEHEPEPEPEASSQLQTENLLVDEVNDDKPKPVHVIKDSSAVVISFENKKYMPAFTAKFIDSLAKSRIKPDVIALMNDAVSLASYDSKTCEALKELEASGVEVLISEACADRMGITEALGTGTLSDMGEIIEKIFSCEKVVSL